MFSQLFEGAMRTKFELDILTNLHILDVSSFVRLYLRLLGIRLLRLIYEDIGTLFCLLCSKSRMGHS